MDHKQTTTTTTELDTLTAPPQSAQQCEMICKRNGMHAGRRTSGQKTASARDIVRVKVSSRGACLPACLPMYLARPEPSDSPSVTRSRQTTVPFRHHHQRNCIAPPMDGHCLCALSAAASVAPRPLPPLCIQSKNNIPPPRTMNNGTTHLNNCGHCELMSQEQTEHRYRRRRRYSTAGAACGPV